MKNALPLALAALLLGAHAPAYANPMCDSIGGFAETIMVGRQMGLPLPTMLEILSTENKFDNPADFETAQDIILRAYEYPLYMSERFKNLEIGRFRDRIIVECYRGWK